MFGNGQEKGDAMVYDYLKSTLAEILDEEGSVVFVLTKRADGSVGCDTKGNAEAIRSLVAGYFAPSEGWSIEAWEHTALLAADIFDTLVERTIPEDEGEVVVFKGPVGSEAAEKSALVGPKNWFKLRLENGRFVAGGEPNKAASTTATGV
jgi:hypothetical protein